MERTKKKSTKVALTFFCCVTYDDLSTSLAGLFHGQRRAEALLMLPEALAFFEAIFLHNLMGHCASAGEGELMLMHNMKHSAIQYI